MAHSFNVLIACMPLIPVKPYLAYLRNICLDSLILDTYATTGHLTTKYAIWTFCIQMVFKDIIYKHFFFRRGYRRKEEKNIFKKILYCIGWSLCCHIYNSFCKLFQNIMMFKQIILDTNSVSSLCLDFYKWFFLSLCLSKD